MSELNRRSDSSCATSSFRTALHRCAFIAQAKVSWWDLGGLPLHVDSRHRWFWGLFFPLLSKSCDPFTSGQRPCFYFDSSVDVNRSLSCSSEGLLGCGCAVLSCSNCHLGLQTEVLLQLWTSTRSWWRAACLLLHQGHRAEWGQPSPEARQSSSTEDEFLMSQVVNDIN